MYSSASKALSFILAITLSSLVLVLPQTLTNSDNTADHSLLTILMLGIMLGFIHSVGFKPMTSLYRCIFSPIIAWLIMLYGVIHIIGKIGWSI